MKILIIEDEAKTAAYLKKGLEENGSVADVAADGETSAYVARQGQYDLMILDVMLPGKDGWPVLKELRQRRDETPVLFLTVRDAVADRVHGLELGADDGLRRTSILAALGNAVVLLVVTGGIAWEGIRRLFDPEPSSGVTIMVVAAVGLAVNGITAGLFMSGRKGNLNIRGAFVHMASDALVAAGVVAGGLILWTGWRWLDPAISAVIVLGTWSLDGDSRSAIFVIMARFACRFLLMLIALAVVGGPTLHLAQPPQFVPSAAVADVPCDMAMPMADAGHGAPMLPCKGMTPDCIKQMGCVADVALPTRMVGTDVVFAFRPVAYWPARSEMAGVVHEPAYLPPRTT